MKAVQIVKPNQLEVIDIEKPVIDSKNNVLVKMTAAGICGSDVGIYHGTNAAATYPRIIGHEMVGVVAEVGDTVSSLKIGDRVIINQVTSCGHCYPCSKNRGNVCDNLKVRGVHIDGGYREYIAVPESDCYLLPDSLSDQDAVHLYLCHVLCTSNTRLNASGNSCTIFASPMMGTRSSFIKAGMPRAWACFTREYAHAGAVRIFLLCAPVIVPTTIQLIPERSTLPGSSNNGSKVT